MLSVMVLASMTVGLTAWADAQTEFEKGRNAYLARAYEEASARFRALLEGKSPPRERQLVAQSRMFWGASLFATGKKAEAIAIFEKLLLEDPEYEPDPLSFPTAVVNEFIDTRARIRQLLRQAAEDAVRREEERKQRELAERTRVASRVAALEQLARTEVVVESHSRWIALVPFGVGQFQNGNDTLGWFFLGAEAALFLASAITVPIYLEARASAETAYEARDLSVAQQYADRANAARVANLAFVGAFALTAVSGIVESQWKFVPERRQVRTRTLPELGLGPGGVTFLARF
jgi:tetratricopeptide (TPR) repeat protein